MLFIRSQTYMSLPLSSLQPFPMGWCPLSSPSPPYARPLSLLPVLSRRSVSLDPSLDAEEKQTKWSVRPGGSLETRYWHSSPRLLSQIKRDYQKRNEERSSHFLSPHGAKGRTGGSSIELKRDLLVLNTCSCICTNECIDLSADINTSTG